MGAKFKFFHSKEEYLNFRRAWANSLNDPRSKKTLIRHEEYNSTEISYGWINSSHVVLVNILCDKPLNNGFTQTQNKNKIDNGKSPDQSFRKAINRLKVIKDRLIRLDLDRTSFSKSIANNWSRCVNSWTEEFLEPYKGTVTKEMLKEIDILE